MSTISVNGAGVTQATANLAQDVWRRIAPGNQNRMFLVVTNTTAHPVWLYMGPTAPVAVDGTVAFKCLQAAGAGAPYDDWTSECRSGIFRGDIWALCVGFAGTVVVGEW